MERKPFTFNLPRFSFTRRSKLDNEPNMPPLSPSLSTSKKLENPCGPAVSPKATTGMNPPSTSPLKTSRHGGDIGPAVSFKATTELNPPPQSPRLRTSNIFGHSSPSPCPSPRRFGTFNLSRRSTDSVTPLLENVQAKENVLSYKTMASPSRDRLSENAALPIRSLKSSPEDMPTKETSPQRNHITSRFNSTPRLSCFKKPFDVAPVSAPSDANYSHGHHSGSAFMAQDVSAASCTRENTVNNTQEIYQARGSKESVEVISQIESSAMKLELDAALKRAEHLEKEHKDLLQRLLKAESSATALQQEKAEVLGELESCRTEKLKAEARIDELNAEVEDLQFHLSESSTQLKNREAEIEDLNRLLNEASEKISTLDEQVTSFEIENSSLKSQLEETRNDLSEANQKLETLNTLTTDLKKEYGTLQNELLNAREGLRVSAEEHQQIMEEEITWHSSTRASLEEVQTRISMLTTELEKSNQSYNELQQTAASLADDKFNLETRIHTLETDLNLCEQSLDSALGKVSLLQSNCNNLQALLGENETKLEMAVTELSQSKNEVEILQMENKHLLEKLKTEEHQREKFIQEEKSRERQFDELSRFVSNIIQQSNNVTEESLSLLKDLFSDVQSITGRCEGTRSMIESLEEEAVAYTRSVTQVLNSSCTHQRELEEKLSTLTIENATLCESSEQTRILNERVIGLETQIRKLDDELETALQNESELKAHKESLEAELLDTHRAMETAEIQHTKAMSEMAQFQRQLKDEIDENSTHRQELMEKLAALEKDNAIFHELNEQTGVLNERIIDLETQIRSLEDELETALKNESKLRAQKESLETELRDSRSLTRTAETRLTNALSDVAQYQRLLEIEISKNSAHQQEFQGKLAILEKDNEILLEYKDQAVILDEKIVNLESELCILEQDLETALTNGSKLKAQKDSLENELRSKLCSLETAEKQLENALSDIAQCKRQLENEQSLHNAALVSLAECRLKLSEEEQKNNTNVNELKEKQAKCDQQESHLRCLKRALDVANQNVILHEEKIKSLESILTAKESELSSLIHRHNMSVTEVNKLRDSKLKIENDQLRRDIENLETKYTETKQQNETLLNTLRNLKTNAAEDTSVGPNETNLKKGLVNNPIEGGTNFSEQAEPAKVASPARANPPVRKRLRLFNPETQVKLEPTFEQSTNEQIGNSIPGRAPSPQGKVNKGKGRAHSEGNKQSSSENRSCDTPSVKIEPEEADNDFQSPGPFTPVRRTYGRAAKTIGILKINKTTKSAPVTPQASSTPTGSRKRSKTAQ